MAKVTYTVPITGQTITAHNGRESLAVSIFISNLKDTARAAVEGYEWALEAVRLGGCTSRTVQELHGMADVFYYMDMIDEGISSVTIEDIVRTLYDGMRYDQEVSA